MNIKKIYFETKFYKSNLENLTNINTSRFNTLFITNLNSIQNFNYFNIYHTINFKPKQISKYRKFLEHKNFQLKNEKITDTIKLLDKGTFKFILIESKTPQKLNLIKLIPSISNVYLHRNISLTTSNKVLTDRLKFINPPKFYNLLLQTKNYHQFKSNYTNFKNKYAVINTTFKLYSTPKLEDITTGLKTINNLLENKFNQTKALNPNLFIGIIIPNYSDLFSCNYRVQFTKFVTIIKQKIDIITKRDFIHKPTISLTENFSITYGGLIAKSGVYSIEQLNDTFFQSSYNYLFQHKASKTTSNFSYNVLVESLWKQYNSQGIYLVSCYFELIAKKMTSFVKIQSLDNNILAYNSILSLSLANLINCSYKRNKLSILHYKPIVLGLSKTVACGSNCLSVLGFQETTKELIKFVIENKYDWFCNLKSKIMIADLILSGSGWTRYFTC